MSPRSQLEVASFNGIRGLLAGASGYPVVAATAVALYSVLFPHIHTQTLRCLFVCCCRVTFPCESASSCGAAVHDAFFMLQNITVSSGGYEISS